MNDKLKTYATTTMLFSSLLIGSSGAAFAAPGSVEGVVSLAQDNRVKGTVVDDKGEPLIGAVIRIVGADVSFAAVTDMDGKFSIKVPNKNATMGHRTKRI